MKKALWLLVTLATLWQWGCMPFEEQILTEVNLNVRDQLFQKITDFQDRQQVDSLYHYFRHADPSYRYLAARAFASVRKPETIDSLATLLDDEVDAVRSVAAYAIGQTGSELAVPILVNAFVQEDTAKNFKLTNRAILEAIGKCGSEQELRFLSTTTTYQARDTFLLEGQAWGIYRFALRDIILPEGTSRMVTLATQLSYPLSVRLIAANYLYRARNIEVQTFADDLVPAFRTETDARIRMALAIGVGKTKTEAAQNALLAQFREEKDYRVRCNILRALSNFPYDASQELVREALKDPNFHVAQRASQHFLENGIAEDASSYWRSAKDSVHWQTSVGLYAAALRHLPPNRSDIRNPLNYELRALFFNYESPYQKAAVLDALAEFGWNYRFIFREGIKLESNPVKTGTISALAKITSNPQFRQNFGGGYVKVARDIGLNYISAIRTGDPAMIAVAADALRNAPFNYASYLPADSLQVLEIALQKLEIPRETETYNALQQAIDHLKGNTATTPDPPAFNHPINWQFLSDLSEQPGAVIKTDRGEISMRLLPLQAPGTVANFIQLARDGFFDGTNFHRVVPNFVIQGGCPRGDGYGSLDYTIRSELSPLHYDQEGYVGMASAGNHTEGTQFFITHSPTPHLDGNYTIFAKITQGMDVVHATEIGTVMQEVRINR